MRALDLFSGAGGATRGLQKAGFHVTGIDAKPQPNYCGDHFIHTDARSFPLLGYDFIWASPPCQAFTSYRRKKHADGTSWVHDAPNYIPEMRARLKASGIPYVIENVEGAPLENAVMLCGSMFGLPIRRHRHFEASFPILTPVCQHHLQKGQHGLFPCAGNRTNPRFTIEIGVWRIPLEVQQAAMQIDWMGLKELSQAIPPAYSTFLARQAFKMARKREGPSGLISTRNALRL